MVSGINPSRIRHGRNGESAADAIILEERPDPPRRPPREGPWTLPPNVTTEDVVRTLDQKSVLPVLKNMFQFFVSQNNMDKLREPTPGPFMRRAHVPEAEPPAKKRKLARVPAGAADWDVPYPFDEGDGPEGYHQSWERDRAKQLVNEVVDIFKEAANKASFQKETYERARQFHLANMARTSNPYTQPLVPATIASQSIDQLLQSLLSDPGLSDASNGQTPTGDSVDHWMATFKDIMPSDDGTGFENLSFDDMLNQFTGGHLAEEMALSASRDASEPASAHTPAAFDDSLFSTMTSDTLFQHDPPPAPTSIEPSLTLYSSSTAGVSDLSIDPLLLALSSDGPSSTRDGSPMSSTPSLSLGNLSASTTPGPDTPLMAHSPFDLLGGPDLTQHAQQGTLLQQVLRQQLFNPFTSGQEWFGGFPGVAPAVGAPYDRKGKGKTNAQLPTMLVDPMVASSSNTGPGVFDVVRTSVPPKNPIPNTALSLDFNPFPQPASSAEEKQKRNRELLVKAKARRDATIEEQRKANEEVRKLTIDHAVLSRLAMHYGPDGAGSGGVAS